MSRTTGTTAEIPQQRVRKPLATGLREALTELGGVVQIRGESRVKAEKPAQVTEEFFVAGSVSPELSPELDYNFDLDIDPDALDAEFLDHARVAMKYVEESSRANREAAMAEERVKTKRAELIKETMGTDFGKNAATQEAYYRTDKEYQRLKQEWIDATYTADLVKGAVFQFTARKVAIEKEIYLVGIGYNAAPLEPRNLADASTRLREQKDIQTQAVIRERMKN